MKKKWTLSPVEDSTAAHLSEVLGIAPVFCQLLAQRNIATFSQAKTFFRPNLNQLHDPFLMKDMDLAVFRIKQAIEQQERILLFGDYDVDGTTCVALLHEFLLPIHPYLAYYIPDRHKEGYGISRGGIEFAAANNCTLIIAMDCGIRANEQVAHAAKLGLDFIICDHHLPGAKVPGAQAVLDPLQEGCGYPYKGLSGCGVVFKLAEALTQFLDLPEAPLFKLLDILVLSIAADIVPITGENRVLAYLGLQTLNQTNRPGLKALIEKSRRKNSLTISDIVFGIAPMINAAGRLGDAKLSVRLLLTKSREDAANWARTLHFQNEKRKEEDQYILRSAKKIFEALPDYCDKQSIVLFNEKWHKGVVGIAAARMVEAYHKPTILLTASNGMATGSARSIPGFPIYEAIKSCSDLMERFGGHDYAAGMTLPIKNVPLLQQRFEKVVQSQLTEEMKLPILKVHAYMLLKDINEQFWRLLKQMAPFGPGNRNPVFVSQNVQDTGETKLLKGQHLKLVIRQEDGKVFTGMAFGMGEYFAQIKSGQPFDIAYKIEQSNWNGIRQLQLMIKGIQF